MADYIKREDALNAFRRVYMVPSQSKAKDIYEQQIVNTYREIESIKAVDVVPRELYELALSDVVTLSVERKHGKWKEITRYGIDSQRAICECSVCGENAWVYDDEKRKFKYCPNCGAEMNL